MRISPIKRNGHLYTFQVKSINTDPSGLCTMDCRYQCCACGVTLNDKEALEPCRLGDSAPVDIAVDHDSDRWIVISLERDKALFGIGQLRKHHETDRGTLREAALRKEIGLQKDRADINEDWLGQIANVLGFEDGPDGEMEFTRLIDQVRLFRASALLSASDAHGCACIVDPCTDHPTSECDYHEKQSKRIKTMDVALLRLACLGNGAMPGNSEGNWIARRARGDARKA